MQAGCSYTIGFFKPRQQYEACNQSFAILAGDGPEERKCADKRGWPFVQVCLHGNRPDRGAGRRLTEITAEGILQEIWQ
jgi:hypothetical protein